MAAFDLKRRRRVEQQSIFGPPVGPTESQGSLVKLTRRNGALLVATKNPVRLSYAGSASRPDVFRHLVLRERIEVASTARRKGKMGNLAVIHDEHHIG